MLVSPLFSLLSLLPVACPSSAAPRSAFPVSLWALEHPTEELPPPPLSGGGRGRTAMDPWPPMSTETNDVDVFPPPSSLLYVRLSVLTCGCGCCFPRQADPWRQTRTHTPVQPLGSCSLCRPRQENLADRSSSASARHVQPDPTGRTPCCIRGLSEIGLPWGPVTQATTGNEFTSGELWPLWPIVSGTVGHKTKYNI